MFTGLVETVGVLRGLTVHGAAGTVSVTAAFPTPDLAIGDSVAVNGACLTVTAFGNGTIHFHALAETLRRTNLGHAAPGDPLNLERALRLGDRLGGHIVAGHVDGTARVLAIGRAHDDLELRVALDPQLAPEIIMKGSIAINGVSLTISHLDDASFGVSIIPHTWSYTNLHALQPGALVNLETDVLGKYVRRLQDLRDGDSRTSHDSTITMDTLAQAGSL